MLMEPNVAEVDTPRGFDTKDRTIGSESDFNGGPTDGHTSMTEDNLRNPYVPDNVTPKHPRNLPPKPTTASPENGSSGRKNEAPPPLNPFGRPPSASGGFLPPRPSSQLGQSGRGGSIRGDPFASPGLRRSSTLNGGIAQLQSARSNSIRKSDVSSQLIMSNPALGASGRGGLPPMIVSTMPSEVKNGNFSSEDRAHAAQHQHQHRDPSEDGDDDGPLFMPNLKREQFIPVRIAREKIKEVLSEMAQMKQKHLAAINTMEKQHQYLKSQLEATCAAYAKKLTNDYNTRVSALDAEYCRRLARLSPATAAAEVEERLRSARVTQDALESKTAAALAAKEQEMEALRTSLTAQLDRERARADDRQAALLREEERSRELEMQSAALDKELNELKDGAPKVDPALEAHVAELEHQNEALRAEVNTARQEGDLERIRLKDEIRRLENDLYGTGTQENSLRVATAEGKSRPPMADDEESDERRDGAFGQEEDPFGNAGAADNAFSPRDEYE